MLAADGQRRRAGRALYRRLGAGRLRAPVRRRRRVAAFVLLWARHRSVGQRELHRQRQRHLDRGHRRHDQRGQRSLPGRPGHGAGQRPDRRRRAAHRLLHRQQPPRLVPGTGGDRRASTSTRAAARSRVVPSPSTLPSSSARRAPGAATSGWCCRDSPGREDRSHRAAHPGAQPDGWQPTASPTRPTCVSTASASASRPRGRLLRARAAQGRPSCSPATPASSGSSTLRTSRWWSRSWTAAGSISASGCSSAG